MKKLLIFTLILFLFLTIRPVNAMSSLHAEGRYIVDEYGKPMHLAGCLGVLKCFHYNDNIFHSEAELNEAKSLGMQILRIGIDMGSYVTAPYTYNDSFFSQPGGLDWVLDWCENNSIKVILNANFAIEFGNYFTYAEGHGFPAYMTPATNYTNNWNGRQKAWSDFWYNRSPQEDSKNQLKDAWMHVVNRYKNRQFIIAWDIPTNEPTSGYPYAGYEPSSLKPVYYGFVRELIDSIRSVDSDRLIIVETLDTSGFNLPQYADDIGRPNTAYDVHPYEAGGLGRKYDPNLTGIAQNDTTGWNKAGIEDWMQKKVVQTFIEQFNRPVVILEIDHLIGKTEYGDWHQYYRDIYDIYDKLGIWVSSGFRGGGGEEYGMWYSNGTLKPYLDVLTHESSILGDFSTKITGRLKSLDNTPILANITAYQSQTENMERTNQTDGDGNYILSLLPGVYDIQFNLTNFFIPGYSIKLNSINITNDTYNLIQSITGNQTANTVSIVLNVNKSQAMQIYSPKEPSLIKKNGTTMYNVSSLPQLINDTWFYQSPNLYMIITPNVIAASGSAADIQAAVNLVAANGGGTVYLPAGTFYWNGETVNIPAGVNVIGASYAGCMGHENNWTSYSASTILHNNRPPINGSQVPVMFLINPNDPGPGTSHKATRISGIQFEATAPTDYDSENTGGGVAIIINQIYNFRVDHCTFINFSGTSVFVDAGSGWNMTSTAYGVLDHNVVSLPYKLNQPPPGQAWAWGYGFYVRGNFRTDVTYPPFDPIKANWYENVNDIRGNYGGYPAMGMMYVEDCLFRYNRHSLDSIQGGYYVSRFNLFDNQACMYAAGMADLHGLTFGSGRGNEVYNNTFIAFPGDQSTSYPWIDRNTFAYQLRGGAGLFFNNKYYGNILGNGEGAAMAYLSLQEDQAYCTVSGYCSNPAYTNQTSCEHNGGVWYPTYNETSCEAAGGVWYPIYHCPWQDVNETYIWNNEYFNTSYLTVSSPLTENVNYFLRAPNQTLDGFNYTPYPYPHLLTLEGLNQVSGILVDKNNNPVNASIFVYLNGTSTMIALTQTNSSGYYSFQIPNGTYDIRFNLTNFFIQGYAIKILNLNITNDTYDIIKQITGNSTANRVSFVADINNTQTIQVYSTNPPSVIKKNNTLLTNVSSTSQMTNNTWFYDSTEKKIYIKFNGFYIVTAGSGSVTDIQAAVNAASAAGGGDVYIPAGNWTFNINQSKICINNEPCGVQIPGGVNLFGAGNNQTILYCPLTGWDSGAYNPYGWSMFVLEGSNNKPIRISGIYFQGNINYTLQSIQWWNGTAYIPEIAGGENANLVAISEYGVKNFRIDYNTFIDFDNTAIGADNNYVQNPEGNRGVIDHNVIDNPYKDVYWNYTGQYPIWAYGIIVGGDSPSAMAWRPLSEVLGKYENDVVYIEDNSFRRCRHDIAGVGSGSGGWYVARHNYFTDNILEHLGSFVDNHGGGRGFEVYNNTFVDVPADYRSLPDHWGQYLNRGVNPRGGSGVIFNNTIINCNQGVGLTNDQDVNSKWRLHDFWVWNNTFVNVNSNISVSTQTYGFNDSLPYYNFTYVINESVDYFLRAPNQTLDGFTYIPYPYPHPLTLSS